MNPPVANLNPYGAWYMTPGGLPSPVADPGPAIARARAKLKRLREHPQTEQPLRGRTSTSRNVAILLIAFCLPFGVLGPLLRETMSDSWWMSLATVLAPSYVGIMLIVHWLRLRAGVAGRSPQRALSDFLEPLRESHSILSEAVVVSCDKDDFVRLRPRIDGEPRTNRYRLSDDKGQREYWKDAKFGNANWQMLHLTDVRCIELAPDLAVIEACVAVVMHGRSPFVAGLMTGFAVPFALIGAVPAVALGINVVNLVGLGLCAIPIATTLGFHIYKWSGGHAHQFRLRKLMVRVHDEWRVFNGELQGPEEGDLSWLLQPDQKE